jgi:hypothetical protein
MSRIVIRLDPQLLANPDLDIRYQLPDLLAKRSGGIITDDGHDYAGLQPLLILFLKASNLELALACVLDVIENVPLLDNNLRQSAVVAIGNHEVYEVVYPKDFTGQFLPV